MIKEPTMPNLVSPENQPPVEKFEAEERENLKNNSKIDVSNDSAEIVSTLEYLRSYDNRGISEYSPGRDPSEVWQIRDKTNNYFIINKISQILKEPLEDFTNRERRQLLKANWANIIAISHLAYAILPVLGEKDPSALKGLDPADKTIISDIGVEKIFELYRQANPEFFYWHEWTNLQSRNNDKRLKINYDITPSYRNDDQDKEEEFCYTRINAQYGVIYNLRGKVDLFFELDPEIEKQNKEKKKNDGEISESNLKFFINQFNKARAGGDSEQFLHYLQIRNLLPENLKKIIDEKLKFNIPKELDRKFTTRAEFEGELVKHKPQLLENLSDGQEEKIDFLISELSTLLKQRKEAAKEKYFGYASEEIKRLDFFNSFNLLQPDGINSRTHFTICYYLYLRKDLPDNLVREFESKFKIKVPENLKEFDIFDDYLATPDQELLKPFSHYPDFQEMAAWLNQKIADLSQKIKETKNTPKRLTLSEILEKEGFGKEKMSEEKYNKLLLTYETLIELPFVEKIKHEFGINLEDYSVREQVQFVNFLSTKSVTEVQKVKQFLSRGDEEISKINRVKAFLSLESGQDMGDKILNIGQLLEKHPQTADLLFSEYARLVDSTEQAATDIERLYNEIFFEKQIDKNEISRAILKRAGKLLEDAEKKLKNTPENDKSAIAKELVEELIREQMAQKIMLDDFRNIANQLNKRYGEISLATLDDEAKRNTDYMESDDFITSVEKKQPEVAETIKREKKKHKKYDSSRLRNDIRSYQALYTISAEQAEALKSEGGMSEAEIEALREREKKAEEPKYKPIVEKLQAMLNLQIALEQKLEQIVYGKEQTEDERKVEKSLPTTILNKYQELVTLTNKSKKELASLFKGKIDISDVELDKITKNILIKADECLNKFNELINQGEEVNEAEIIKSLERYKADLILTASVFKTLAGRGDIKLEDVKGVSFEQSTAAQMTSSPRVVTAVEKEIKANKNIAIPGSAFKGKITKMIKNLSNEETKAIDEIVQMLYIYGENYKHKPEFSNKLLASFLKKLKTGGDKVRIYKVLKDDQLMAFYRFDDKDDGNKYFGSFNVNPAIQGSKIGTALMEESLKKEGADCNIEADTDPETLISSKYIENEGFVATGVLKNYAGSNDMILNIHRRTHNRTHYYRDQRYSRSEIIRQYEEGFSGQNSSQPEDRKILKFASPREMLTFIEPLVNNGYAVTRYFFAEPKKNQTVYCALEKTSN